MRLSALLLALLLFCTACTPGIQMPSGPAGTEAIDLTPAPAEPQETPVPTETPTPTAVSYTHLSPPEWPRIHPVHRRVNHSFEMGTG